MTNPLQVLIVAACFVLVVINLAIVVRDIATRDEALVVTLLINGGAAVVASWSIFLFFVDLAIYAGGGNP